MKRCVALLVVMAIIMTSIPITSANENDYQEYAEKLSALNVFKGTGNGYELERNPTRLEGLIMLIRLLGVESEANAMKDEPSVFSDVPNWALGYTNYAYNNGLSNGIGNGLFGSNDQISANAYVTFLLRALGYSDSDFTWDKALEFGNNIGLIESTFYDVLLENELNRGYTAKLSYDALQQTLKNTQVLLIRKLVLNGAIQEDTAKSLGLLPIGATIEPYGFTSYYEPGYEPLGIVKYYDQTDTIYYVVVGDGFPEGSIIHQAWSREGDGIIAETNLNITTDIQSKYIGFWLIPNKKLPIGTYTLTLTWSVDGVEGEWISDTVEVR